MAEILNELEWFERLVSAAQTGQPLDLTEPDSANSNFVNPKFANRWSKSRSIPATAIRRVLTLPKGELEKLDPNGLQIYGARIEGPVDWNRIIFPRRLSFKRCAFLSPVLLRDSQTSSLIFWGCRLRGIDLNAARIEGGMVGFNSHFDGEIAAAGVDISGQFRLDGATLTNRGGRVLVLDSSRISSGLFAEGVVADGEIRAVGANFGDQLNLNHAALDNAAGCALHLDQARIDGSLFAEGITVIGKISAPGIYVGGEVNLKNGSIAGETGKAISLNNARIGVGLYAPGLTIARGEFQAVGARVSGDIDLNGASLSNVNATALRLDGARIDSDLLAKKLVAFGKIRAVGALISGELNLENSWVSNAHKPALLFDGIRVEKDLVAEGAVFDGNFQAIGAIVNGQLNLNAAALGNPSRLYVRSSSGCRVVLNLSQAVIIGGFFGRKLIARGELQAIGAKVTGRLDLSDANLTNHAGDDVIVFESANIDELLLLPERIEGNIHLDMVKIGTLHLPGETGRPGDLRPLSFADSTISAAGWSVIDVRGSIRVDWKVARDYLGKIQVDDGVDESDFIPQPWFAIADVYERIGRPDYARKMRFYTEKKVSENIRGVTKFVRTSYAVTVGYGYRPFLPVLWLIAVLFAAGMLIWTNQSRFLNATKIPVTANDFCADTSPYACFNTVAYTLQNVVPAASGPLRIDWVLSTSGWWPVALGVALSVLRLFAWGFAALTLAAMTGLLRKR